MFDDLLRRWFGYGGQRLSTSSDPRLVNPPIGIPLVVRNESTIGNSQHSIQILNELVHFPSPSHFRFSGPMPAPLILNRSGLLHAKLVSPSARRGRRTCRLDSSRTTPVP